MIGVLVFSGCAVEVDGNQVGATSSAVTSYDCIDVGAGEGFASIPIEDANVLQTLTFSIHTSGTVDAVVGLSAGPPTAFTSFATAFRLNPSGYVDVRDGGGYRADFTYAYTSDTTARLIADLTTHTYSVELGNALDPSEVARQYRFRTEQQGVTHLDHLGVIVDSATGFVTVCPNVGASRGVAYSREGFWEVAPRLSGQAVISDGTTTLSLDAGNHVLGSIARGGKVAADGSGNVFLATLSGTTLSLEKLDANLVSQWTRTRTLPTGHTLLSVIADGNGGAALATRNSGVGSVYAFRFAANGTYLGSHGATGETIAVSPTAAFVAHSTNTTLTIRKLSTSWSTLWSNTYAGSAAVSAMAAAPDGSIVAAGNLWGPIDFGGGTLAPEQTAPEQTPNDDFIVRLSASGAHVFSQRTETDGVGGIATNGHWIMLSATYWTQFPYPRLYTYAMDGTAATDVPTFVTGVPYNTTQVDHGQGRDIALASDGHFWWNETMRWPTVAGYPYVFAH
ncbi:MAG TPA: hypothetical protein VLT45_19985 [Kofleriaceae bacterium]|nr:hypothetical protein [Kofleriaceae bacterium]